MNFATLPLLFNGLFFSISPSAVHHTVPPKPEVVINKEVTVTKVQQSVCQTVTQQTGEGPSVVASGHCSANGKTRKVQVSFKMNDRKELEVISVSGTSPGINAAIMQNLGTWMPNMKSYLTVNRTYSFTVEICDQQVS